LELAVVVTDTAGVVICGVVLDTPVAISLVDETISVFDLVPILFHWKNYKSCSAKIYLLERKLMKMSKKPMVYHFQVLKQLRMFLLKELNDDIFCQ
jgi:hypothetical protein